MSGVAVDAVKGTARGCLASEEWAASYIGRRTSTVERCLERQRNECRQQSGEGDVCQTAHIRIAMVRLSMPLKKLSATPRNEQTNAEMAGCETYCTVLEVSRSSRDQSY